MRLAEFITQNLELILADWSEFAKTLSASALALDEVELRDHASLMLGDIVRDLEIPDAGVDEKEKAKGLADTPESGPDSAAQAHGAGRAEDGFTVDEMVAEYRALRSSVLRHWSEACPINSASDFQDVMRFNESIDQSLAEALRRFTRNLDASKEMFVAVLGHDLRTPLSAVLMSGLYLRDSGDLAEPHQKVSARIVASAKRMTEMVDELLDFTRGRLGSGIPVQRDDTDLGSVARDAVAEMQTVHPSGVFELTITGNVRGSFDAARISQVLTNLLGNAVQYGTVGLPVHVSVTDAGAVVELRVRNSGPVIPSNRVAGLFSPFKRLRSDSTTDLGAHNLGLGLYVAERVAAAHGGNISVNSTEESGTEFLVRLPRVERRHERRKR